jgi:hypothetical protein
MNDIKFSNVVEFLGIAWILKILFTILHIFLKINTKIRVIFFLTSITSLFTLMYIANENNYYFDKNLEKYINKVSNRRYRLLAKPVLQQVYRDGVLYIENNAYCPFEPTQIHLDLVEVLINLSNIYKNLPIITYNYAEFPTTPFRLTGNYFADQVFNSPSQIQCDTARRFKSLILRRKQETILMQTNPLFQNHSIYRKTQCLNCHVFFENIKLHTNQLFGNHVKKINNILFNIDTNKKMAYILPEGKVWVFKYGKFVYIVNENNGNQGHYQKLQQGKTLIFKKLKYEDFQYYDNGNIYNILKFLYITI